MRRGVSKAQGNSGCRRSAGKESWATKTRRGMLVTAQCGIFNIFCFLESKISSEKQSKFESGNAKRQRQKGLVLSISPHSPYAINGLNSSLSVQNHPFTVTHCFISAPPARLLALISFTEANKRKAPFRPTVFLAQLDECQLSRR